MVSLEDLRCIEYIGSLETNRERCSLLRLFIGLLMRINFGNVVGVRVFKCKFLIVRILMYSLDRMNLVSIQKIIEI